MRFVQNDPLRALKVFFFLVNEYTIIVKLSYMIFIFLIYAKKIIPLQLVLMMAVFF